MYRILAATFGLVMAASAVHPQQVAAPAAVRLDPGKPTTYLRFERHDGEAVWLRLHNNSRWAVAIRTEEPSHTQGPAGWVSLSVRKMKRGA